MARYRFVVHGSAWLLAGCCLVSRVHAGTPVDHPPVPATTNAAAALVELRVAGAPVQTFDAKALAALPQTSVDASAHDEPMSHWQGVSLVALLQQAGIPLDQPLHGHMLSSYVRITATDHYQLVLGLSDLDATLGHLQVILADQRDGKPLGGDGPFRLIIATDARPARWVRNVTSIELVDGSTPPVTPTPVMSAPATPAPTTH